MLRNIVSHASLPWASTVPFCACTLLLATTTWRCAARRPRTGRLLLTTTKTKTQTSDAAALADFAKAIRLRGVAGDLMRRLLGGAPLLLRGVALHLMRRPEPPPRPRYRDS